MSDTQLISQVTQNTFQSEVMQSADVVIVDFWAPWCGPCRSLAPTLESIAQEYQSKGVKIVKINVDENQEIAVQFKIKGIPSLLFFHQGHQVDQLVGNQSKETIVKTIQKHLF